MAVPGVVNKAYGMFGHWFGRVTGRYYFEDFIRVYPDGLYDNRLGMRRPASDEARRNFANHVKFYRFASQFVRGRRVADVGCGSGYGSKVLRDAGATCVVGFDISKSSIAFAKAHFGDYATFQVGNAVDLPAPAASVDVSLSSEVLEHVKEYGKEQDAIDEMARLTRPGGLLVMGTPNSELMGDHGFHFDEMQTLMRRSFKRFCIFENALIPVGPQRLSWERRVAAGATGVVVSQNIDLGETPSAGGESRELKRGLPAGPFEFGDYIVDTTLLHNTHSWIVLAINER